MDTFEKALKFTLQWEGGYVNNPNDSGGATNKGITQRVYDEYLVNKGLPPFSVRNILQKEVEDIYKKLYWNKIGADSLDPKLAIAAFDFAVNSGVNRARRYIAQCDSAEKLLLAREQYVKQIGVGKNSVFLKGWLNRVNALRKYLQEEA